MNWKRWRWLFLVVLGIGVWVATLVVFISGPPQPVSIPPSIADLPLRAHLFGPEAAAEIERLHRRRIPMSGAAVAIYGEGNAVLWVSEAWIPLGAWVLEQRMTQRIRTAETPFTLKEEREVNGVRVYVLEGTGQMHYYFHVGARLYWLAVDPPLAEVALDDLLRFAQRAEGQ